MSSRDTRPRSSKDVAELHNAVSGIREALPVVSHEECHKKLQVEPRHSPHRRVKMGMNTPNKLRVHSLWMCVIRQGSPVFEINPDTTVQST